MSEKIKSQNLGQMKSGISLNPLLPSPPPYTHTKKKQTNIPFWPQKCQAGLISIEEGSLYGRNLENILEKPVFIYKNIYIYKYILGNDLWPDRHSKPISILLVKKIYYSLWCCFLYIYIKTAVFLKINDGTKPHCMLSHKINALFEAWRLL